MHHGTCVSSYFVAFASEIQAFDRKCVFLCVPGMAIVAVLVSFEAPSDVRRGSGVRGQAVRLVQLKGNDPLASFV